MNKELEAKLAEHCKAEGWDYDRAGILELLSEAGYGAVTSYGHDKHRWYTLYNVVVKIGDLFVDFVTFSSSGDEPAFDREDSGKMVWDSAVEVFPTEVKVIKYVTADWL